MAMTNKVQIQYEQGCRWPRCVALTSVSEGRRGKVEEWEKNLEFCRSWFLLLNRHCLNYVTELLLALTPHFAPCHHLGSPILAFFPPLSHMVSGSAFLPLTKTEAQSVATASAEVAPAPLLLLGEHSSNTLRL